MVVGQNQWYLFGVGEFTSHFRTYFRGDSDIHWGLTGLACDPPYEGSPVATVHFAIRKAQNRTPRPPSARGPGVLPVVAVEAEGALGDLKELESLAGIGGMRE